MKLPLLLTQYLYKYKKLNLPGIGSFRLDPAAILPDDHSKNEHEAALGIEFSNNPSVQAEDDLIEFIRVHTGKIRPLAIADLESYLTLGTELLNIGKPFYLEGIGTLTKGQDGRFEFSPGEYVTSRVEEPRHEAGSQAARRKAIPEEIHLEPVEAPERPGRWFVALAIIVGLAVIGWGGYTLYTKNAGRPNAANTVIPDTAGKVEDSLRNARIADSLALASQKAAQLAKGDSVVMKFIILQTYNKEHALRRYNQLLSYDLKVNMDTKDSSFFKVYFAFPALLKDTVHIKDSLKREYAHEVLIEK